MIQCKWIFQNNGTSKEYNPEKLFSTNGEFEVTQIAYASNECKDTINQTITIPQTVSLPPNKHTITKPRRENI
ncbi:MAG: hypothetical protein IPO21_01275 [Bacteroidales bacterium]|nr:hypothetical protein [Bacteroidales bacterium]